MAEYRNIAASIAGQSSGSSSSRATGAFGTPGTSSGGGSGADNQDRSGTGSGGDGGAQRRRRHTGHVSVLACTECRRARAKCDGLRPAVCSRCTSRALTCIYELHTKTHKDDLLREIESIRAEHADLRDEHFDLQATNKNLEKLQHDQSIILDILTNNGHVNEVIKRLREGQSQDSVASWLRARPELSQFIATISESDRHLVAVVKRVESMYDISEVQLNPATHTQWTQVTQSDVLIRHLFELYFTWVHPIHMLFSEVDFLQSYRDGDQMFCSSALVNAICAMGCHLLDNPVPGITSRDLKDRLNLRDGFMDEARGLLRPKGSIPMTSIQAFSVMYLVDLSGGKARSASGYLRIAADHLRTPQESFEYTEEYLQLSQWGIHTLNTAWSGITYQKPFNPLSPRTEVFINVSLDRDAASAQWRYYRQPGDETNVPRRRSFAILTACEQAKLFRVVHNTINTYCGARGKVTAAAIITCYKRFLDWRSNLPEPLAQIDEQAQPLPHVLFLHVQYHTALVQLLTPIVLSGYFVEPDAQSIRDLVVGHARTGLEHINQCQRLYSGRYNMPLTAFCIVHLGDALLSFAQNDPPSSTVFNFCMDVLKQNWTGFPLCGPLQQIFRKSAQDKGVKIPADIEEKMGPIDRYGIDELLDACTRLTYAQPVEQIHRYIDTAIGDQWQEEWERQMIRGKPRTQSISGRTMQITSLLND